MPPDRLGPAVRHARASMAPQPVTGAAECASPQLVVLAAGRGTRFGAEPKCIAPVAGYPLVCHTLAAFARHGRARPVCVVGYEADRVRAALGPRCRFVHSTNPTGGTAWALYEALLDTGLMDADVLVVAAMGDRVIPESVFGRLLEAHAAGGADMTMLSLHLPHPRNRGKGRLLLGDDGSVHGVVEDSEIGAQLDAGERQRLIANCTVNASLYVARGPLLARFLADLDNQNQQGQYYLTDVVRALSRAGGRVHTVTVAEDDPDYRTLAFDVTRPQDLLDLRAELARGPLTEAAEAALKLRAHRPGGQVGAMAEQLDTLAAQPFDPEAPVGIGVAGGRLRLAFMHPDMVRFYGPAWQMPIGSADGREHHQIVAVVQAAADEHVCLSVLNPTYGGDPERIPSTESWQYPDGTLDWHTYEGFGTRLSRETLRAMGYEAGEGGPAGSLARPFPLVLNALASLRTLANGEEHPAVRAALMPPAFRGARIALDGEIPQGGFSSSSAVMVATINALDALHHLELPPETMVSVACQAEYGTGVRAGSLDHSTVQRGLPGVGALISSNPRDGYGVLATHPFPADRIRILFPFSVARDVEAWKWSGGCFSRDTTGPTLTAGEYRKLTGKAAEMAGLLLGLPLDLDFFKLVERDLLVTGEMSQEVYRRVAELLGRLPLRIQRVSLEAALRDRRDWLAGELERTGRGGVDAAARADSVIAALLAGWREPRVHGVAGVPLRAMVGYLFGEVAKNFRLIRHPDEWIPQVALSQRGDRWFEIPPEALPPAPQMRGTLDWERGRAGPELLEHWLERSGARPHDHDEDLSDADLAASRPRPPHLWRGTSFFRGLAMVDLVEAMLWRAFGREAVAVRVNAAGQGDYYQVHADLRRADPEDVKEFIRVAVYRRFGLGPSPEFVEVHPGGGAAGVRLGAFRRLPAVVELLRLNPASDSPSPQTT